MKPRIKTKNKIKEKDFDVQLDENVIFRLLKEHQEELNKLVKESTLFFQKEKDKFRMVENILKHKNDIWYPTEKLINSEIKLNTWFSIKESLPENVNFKQSEYIVEKKEEIKYKCKRIELDLTKKQKHIVNVWLNAYSEMYNESLKYIKENIDEDKKVLNFQYLRNILKIKKEILVKRSNIKVHDIDYAIKLACQNYKSGLTNFKKGFIKYFRVRYWRKQRKEKIIDMEKQNFNNNTIRKNILGEVKGYYNGERFNFNSIESDCRLQKNEGKYYLYVPNLVVANNNNANVNNKSKQITIDPGIRRFGTGITEDKIVKIGEKSNIKIRDYLLKKDLIMSKENIDKKIKIKNEKIINKKIKNLVNELHWKTINYLTKNYETVLIGNMSSKGIVSKNGNLNKTTKRIAMHLNFYKFHERLKYKCNINNLGYGKINEWMTSKMCSLCGNLNENLGGSEIYKCSKCNVKMERDINGARNIYIKAILQ
jgi:putative transposase